MKNTKILILFLFNSLALIAMDSEHSLELEKKVEKKLSNELPLLQSAPPQRTAPMLPKKSLSTSSLTHKKIPFDVEKSKTLMDWKWEDLRLRKDELAFKREIMGLAMEYLKQGADVSFEASDTVLKFDIIQSFKTSF